MSLPVYSSRDVKVAWSGTELQGLAPDSFITFTRNADLTDEEVGAGGDLSISRLPDRTGSCSIILQQQAPANLRLAEAISRQESSGVFITGHLTIQDPSGSVLAELTNAHIKTAPEVDLGSSATGKSRTWVFFCEGMRFQAAPGGTGIVDSLKDLVVNEVDGLIDRASDEISGFANKLI